MNNDTVEGQSNMNERMSLAIPVLPRYKYGMVGYRLGNKTKAACSKPRIILHPESQQKYRKLAELDRFIKGE
jgi:hypothetical protein